jgi:hypothetical protein
MEGDRSDVLAIGPSGQLYVADSFDGRVDRYNLDGDHLGTVLGPDVDGRKPRVVSIAVGLDDRRLVADDAEKRPGWPRSQDSAWHFVTAP